MDNYLIELSVIHVALILGYWIFLRKERQYSKMRFYLIGATFLALAIPVLKLPRLFFKRDNTMDVVSMESITFDATTITPTADVPMWNYNLLVGLYVGISAFFLIKLLSGVGYLIYLRCKAIPQKFNDVTVWKVAGIKGSFTFFNWIFLSDEINQSQQDYDIILRHEKAHASFGHTCDIMFFEVFRICFWWLPTAWFINKAIREIHEYQADAYALKSYNLQEYSSLLIHSTLKSNGVSLPAGSWPWRRQAGLASSFHDSLILKRLTAMKQQAKKVSPWKLGALAAICALLFTVFACSEDPNKNTTEVGKERTNMQDEIFTIVEAQPEYEGGIDAFNNYLREELTYPLKARRMGVEGRVDVEFVVDKDGSVSEVKAIKGIGAGCDEEAVRVLENAPGFKPGTQNGKAVRVRMLVPVVFKLSKSPTDDNSQGTIIIESIQSRYEKLKVDANYSGGEWSGTVYDEQGDALPGASILVGGTTTGTISGSDGKFKVKANESSDLHISFVGYEMVKLEGTDK